VYTINYHRGESTKSPAKAFFESVIDVEPTDKYEVTVTHRPTWRLIRVKPCARFSADRYCQTKRAGGLGTEFLQQLGLAPLPAARVLQAAKRSLLPQFL
jgi:hypothetical protein